MASNRDTDFFFNIFKEAHLAYKLLTDPEVPPLVKLIPAGALLYFLSPIDVLPEAMLGPLGIADDVGVIFFAMKTFVNMSPPHVVARHKMDLGMDVDEQYADESGGWSDAIEGEGVEWELGAGS